MDTRLRTRVVFWGCPWSCRACPGFLCIFIIPHQLALSCQMASAIAQKAAFLNLGGRLVWVLAAYNSLMAIPSTGKTLHPPPWFSSLLAPSTSAWGIFPLG
jgi:hypothetical protein